MRNKKKYHPYLGGIFVVKLLHNDGTHHVKIMINKGKPNGLSMSFLHQ